MDEDERVSRALDSLTNRAITAEAEVKRLEAELLQVMIDRNEAGHRYERAEAALAEALRKAQTVEIGGQVMTQAQFDAARFPLLNPDPPAVSRD